MEKLRLSGVKYNIKIYEKSEFNHEDRSITLELYEVFVLL